MGCTNIIYDLLPEKLFMGYGEEQLSRTLTFDISQMQAELPGGVPMIVYMRPRDELGYLASGVTLDGSTLTWELSAHVMQYKGIGGAQIVLVDESGEETHILKSHVMQMLIGSSIPLTGGEPPEPWETWLEQILAAASRAESAAADAAAQADRAETAEAGAEQALIDAGSPVLYGRAQTLTDAQQQTARGNIAAASAAEVSDLKSATDAISGETRNIFNLDRLFVGYAWNGSLNNTRACAYIPITGGETYIISFSSETASRFDAITVFEKVNISDTTSLYLSGASSGFTRTSSASANFLGIQFTKTAITKADFDGIVLQVEYGNIESPYIQSKTAVDSDVRNNLVLYTTPEEFGAWGDGVHNDTVALQSALNTGKNVYAPNKYKISASISMSPVYPTGQRFDFGSIICTANATALKLNGRCGAVNGFYVESKGNCLSFGETGLTYDWNVNVSILNSTGGACAQYGGGNGNVSEVKLSGERYNYTTVGINILPVGGFVGQISFDSMTFNTESSNGGYAFNANGATYPMTGLACYNVSLEGAHGGFQFVNSQVSTPINPIYCFGLRTSELTVVNGYKLIRLTGNGIIAGDIFCDIFTLDSIDVSLHKPDITLEQSLNIHGRISGYGRGWRNVRIVGNNVFPTWNEEYAGNVSNPTYNDSNLPYTVNLFSGSASWTVDFPFDGTVTFISTADGSTLAINGTTVTMNNTQRCVVRTVADQTSIHVMVLRPNGTEIPLYLAST